jgi:hypothetical protein
VGLAPPDHVRPSRLVGATGRQERRHRPAGPGSGTSRGQRTRGWSAEMEMGEEKRTLRASFSGRVCAAACSSRGVVVDLWLARRGPDPVAPTSKTDKLHSRKTRPTYREICIDISNR